MKESARRRLLEIARNSVAAAVAGREMPEVRDTDPEITGLQGCFVTLKRGNRLRGCLGHFTSRIPLCQLVNEMAAASATEDPRFRFNPILPSEVPQLTIEISVLSPLERTESPLDMELGRHGVYIRRGSATGCFLPQVAIETGWSKEEFLTRCCIDKADLEGDAWKHPRTEVSLFTAEIISEEEEGPGAENAQPAL